MKLSPLEQRVYDLVATPVADLGVRLVRVRLSGSEHQTLQLMIEPAARTRTNPVSVEVEDCAQVSRLVSALLDVEDPIASAYDLEVSSTGAERPLMGEDDLVAYTPHRVKVELDGAVDGLRRFTAMLVAVENGNATFDIEGRADPLVVPVDSIKRARLAYTESELNAFYGLSA